MQHAVSDRHLAVGKDHVDAVGLNPRSLPDRHHVHAGTSIQQLDHVALPRRIEMLDDHEGHAAVGRHGAEQLLERLQPTRRRADPHDREPVALVG